MLLRPVLASLVIILSADAEAQDGWQLVWSDEFEGARIDREKWGFDIDCWGGGNNERQCYTDRPENARIEDGMLVIEGRRETETGAAFPPHWGREAAPVTRDYTSARLVTRDRAAWRYGRFEIRAQLPGHQGSWPAIWMLPEDNTYGGWAASGEIDIMEAVNLGEPCALCPDGVEDRVFGTLHYGGQAPDNTYSGTSLSLEDPQAFHTYAIEWTPAGITWFVDGEAYATQTPEDWYTEGLSEAATPAAPFDKPFHLLLNLAIGGNWPESENLGGVADHSFPRAMRVDFVRVFACPSDPETLASCRNGDRDDH
ncbi:glycoside hydrolase family 16 protein [Maricaulis sp.]|uniref:glycoside hydrolase family 16 protein n=1 Tax=Maricaulis sp. TaxID=1486257 RepID=UPI0025C3EA20|nr:glycoside hydrolase family 16 protein [Maricaulis sp.]